MDWFVLFILGCFLSGIAGHYYGMKLLKDAEEISKRTLVGASADSTIQADLIGGAIKQRAVILGNVDLSWKSVYGKKEYKYYAFDDKMNDYGTHTHAFLSGTSTKLIKFIRICHACGCSVMLRQIGAKVDALQYSEQEYYLSKPDPDMFEYINQ